MPISTPTWDRAVKYISNGCQTLSKRPAAFVDGVYPKMLVSGHGCEVIGEDDTAYIDYISALGAILIGYNNPAVDMSVRETINSGQVLLSLPHPKEGELAEKLCSMLGLDKVKFFKTGSEATSAAVRLARAFTGKETVLMCGYNGWHDWAASTYDRPAGVPPSSTKKFIPQNMESIERLCKEPVAAIILEPVLFDTVNEKFFNELRKLCTAREIVLIFDEIVTGFRFGRFGATQLTGIRPDLMCFGKGLGNGYSIAAVGGGQIMNVFERDDFMASGTFSGDLTGISAALATLDLFDSHKIWESGSFLKIGFNKITEELDLGIHCVGYSPRTKFVFPIPAHRALFWQECVKRKILFGHTNFPTQSHGEAALFYALGACRDALRIVKANFKNPETKLEGKMPAAVLR